MRDIKKTTMAGLLLLFLVPALHPFLIPYVGVTSHLLWWLHLAPVASISYLYGVKGAAVACAISVMLLLIGERLFGTGYGEPASWEIALSLAVALSLTHALMAPLAITAGRAARELKSALYTHPLTRLPSRRYLESVIARRNRETAHGHALLFIDIDDFDTINYSLGYDAGDKVLVELGQRLERSVGAEDVVGHLAGDKFAIFSEIEEHQQIETMVKTVRKTLRQPLKIEALELRAVSAGIGISTGHKAGSAGELFRNAGTALSHAKNSGRSGLCYYDQSMHEQAKKRLSILNALSAAIEGSQLVNHYQPIHMAGTGQIVGFEALVRWQHPTEGMIPPGDFIPLAEQAGLIGRLGRVVMLQAIKDFHSWKCQELCKESHFLNINVSPLQLLEPDFCDELEAAARQYELEPNTIVLEITETEMMKSEQTSLQILRDLTSRGFRIAIDDFGSGYSSLNYLHKLPVQILKIDRELVEQLKNREQVALIKPIMEIATVFHFEVIAEGVEEQDQADQLANMSVDYLQGFHLSRPVPADEIVSLLKAVPDNACRIATADS